MFIHRFSSVWHPIGVCTVLRKLESLLLFFKNAAAQRDLDRHWDLLYALCRLGFVFLKFWISKLCDNILCKLAQTYLFSFSAPVVGLYLRKILHVNCYQGYFQSKCPTVQLRNWITVRAHGSSRGVLVPVFLYTPVISTGGLFEIIQIVSGVTGVELEVSR